MGELSSVTIFLQIFVALRICNILYISSGAIGFGNEASHDKEREEKII